LKVFCSSILLQNSFKQKFRHGATADIAMADETDF